MAATRLGRSGQRQRGAFAIMAAFIVPVLFGFGALAVDFGRLLVYKAELQNAMDSCALAASQSLIGGTNPIIYDTARAHALALMDPSKSGLAPRDPASVNRIHFQRDTLNLGNVAVEFSASLNGGWVAATSASPGGLAPAAAKYVRCRYTDEDNPLLLLPVLSLLVPGVASTADVAATAAASLVPSQGACAFPVAVCSLGGGAGANYGRTVGERMTARNSPGEAYGSGNFGWLDFTPPAGGATELRTLINGNGSCTIRRGTPVGQAGTITNLEAAWNARFGVYAPAMGPADAPPDWTGYGYIATTNNFADYANRRAARAPYQNGVGGGNTKLTSAQHGASGSSRRIATAAIVDCSVWNSAGSANPPVLDFACVLLLAPVQNGGSPTSWDPVAATMDIEYLGLANVPGTPCASSGLAGGAFGPLVPTLVH